jgi:nitrate reductase gamma subunit
MPLSARSPFVTILVYVVITASLLVFLAASLARAIWYARHPIHLRWELYPVPHEPPAQAAHGGSYFETSEWWRTTRHFSLWGEVAFMVPEMLFLRALRHANRALWWRSFPFHFGLYLLGASGALVIADAVAMKAGIVAAAGPAASAVHVLYAATGLIGFAMALAGAGGLLHRRLTDPALRPYTTAGDIFNLLFFVVVLALAAIGYATRPAGSPGPLAIAAGLLSFDATVRIGPVFVAALIGGSVLLAYIPLTHMSHFVGKYFTYHAVRWDDTPARESARMAAKLAEQLTYRPTWAASHMTADGTRTWAEIATSVPPEGKRS